MPRAPLLAIVAIALWMTSSVVAQEAPTSEAPPSLRVDRDALLEPASWAYLRDDGSRTVIAQKSTEDGSRVFLTRRDARGAFTLFGSHAQVAVEAPWRVTEAGGTGIESDREQWQRLPALEAGAEEPSVRSWEVSVAGSRRSDREVLPVRPTTELGLVFSLRGVPWRFGTSFSVPLLWRIDRVGDEGPEPLRRAHVRCTGRETIDVQDRRVGCWRIIVESQGRTEPIRAVYWIASKAPFLLERLEEPDGTTLDRIVPDASEAPATSGPSDSELETSPAEGVGEESSGGREELDPAPSNGEGARGEGVPSTPRRADRIP